MERLAKIALLAASAAFLATSGALAGDMSGLFGNTIECTNPSGNATKVHVLAGGKYSLERGGKTIQGTWADSGAQVCYTETDPAPAAGTKPLCTPSALVKVGDTWSVTDSDGTTAQCVLKAGS